jgi:hypothetical protein
VQGKISFASVNSKTVNCLFNWGSSVIKVTGFELHDRDSITRKTHFFSLPTNRLWSPNTPLPNGFRGSFRALKRPEPEVDHPVSR